MSYYLSRISTTAVFVTLNELSPFLFVFFLYSLKLFVFPLAVHTTRWKPTT